MGKKRICRIGEGGADLGWRVMWEGRIGKEGATGKEGMGWQSKGVVKEG